MKKIAVLMAMVAMMAGCSNDNVISITNNTLGTVHFNFRGDVYDVAVGGPYTVVKNIPNGTYDYNVTADMPSTATSGSVTSSGDASLIFEQMLTKYSFYYSYVQSGTTYTVSETKTSSRSSSNPTGAE
jgi:hypothetical protein